MLFVLARCRKPAKTERGQQGTGCEGEFGGTKRFPVDQVMALEPGYPAGPALASEVPSNATANSAICFARTLEQQPG
jgi:hypothetical protein